MTAIRVLLADDHALVRAGIRSVLEAIPGVQVVAETGDGQEVLPLIERHHPHVALLDIAMPGLNGLEVAARVRKDAPGTRVIILSMHATEAYVRQALAAGAAGYLVKDAGVAELELALKAVARGETYLSPGVSRHVVEGYLAGGPGAPAGLERLTPRHREILQLVAEGHTTKDIAARLGISGRTVETHRGELMERLHIHDVAGLVRYAIRAGLVTPDR